MEGVFIRKFEISSCGKSLTLCQKKQMYVVSYGMLL